jgi:predicted GNAT family N-acyltransferase
MHQSNALASLLKKAMFNITRFNRLSLEEVVPPLILKRKTLAFVYDNRCIYEFSDDNATIQPATHMPLSRVKQVVNCYKY